MNEQLTMDLDEILRGISDIARDEGSMDRLRALNMLTKLNAGAAGIGVRLTDEEIQERLIRLMRAAGLETARNAYRAAFPKHQRARNITPEEMSEYEKVAVEKASHIFDVAGYHRMFPDLKRLGPPAQYPRSASVEIRTKWLRDRAVKNLMDRHRITIATESAEEWNGSGPQTEDSATEPGAATTGSDSASEASPEETHTSD
jgi:hypothetical protein